MHAPTRLASHTAWILETSRLHYKTISVIDLQGKNLSYIILNKCMRNLITSFLLHSNQYSNKGQTLALPHGTASPTCDFTVKWFCCKTHHIACKSLNCMHCFKRVLAQILIVLIHPQIFCVGVVCGCVGTVYVNSKEIVVVCVSH